MVTSGNRVSVVCCAAFGERLRSLDLSDPVWIIRPERNNPIIADLHRTASSSEPFADLMETIDEHHWGWVELRVYWSDSRRDRVRLDEIRKLHTHKDRGWLRLQSI